MPIFIMLVQTMTMPPHVAAPLGVSASPPVTTPVACVAPPNGGTSSDASRPPKDGANADAAAYAAREAREFLEICTGNSQ